MISVTVKQAEMLSFENSTSEKQMQLSLKWRNNKEDKKKQKHILHRYPAVPVRGIIETWIPYVFLYFQMQGVQSLSSVDAVHLFAAVV